MSMFNVMFQERVKSAKIIELKRRFSSCSNLGRHIDQNEMGLDSCHDFQVDGLRSSKAPHFISSLYHSIQQNLPIVHNSKLVHSSSVDIPSHNFNSKRLRSGSCPQVFNILTSNKLVSKGSFYNNNIFNSINQRSNASILCEAKCSVNPQNNSFLNFDKLHSTNFKNEIGRRASSSNLNKRTKSKNSTCNTSYDLTDSIVSLDKIENVYSDEYSSYEDLNEESLKNYSPKGLLHSNFSSLSSLKRTVSTECFNLTRNGSMSKCEASDFPCQAGLRKYIRGSFFSNSDIYDLKSPVEGRPLLNKIPCGVPYLKDNKTGKMPRDFKKFFSNNQPNLVKTVSDQQLSSLHNSYIDKSDASKDVQSYAFDEKKCNSVNQNSVYVTSVFLNLTNTQSGKHESKHCLISSRGFKSDQFSPRPSTLCPNQVSSPRTRMPTSAYPISPTSPYSRKRFQPSGIVNDQKQSFLMLLRSIEEVVRQKDVLKNDVDRMEQLLFQNREFLGCLKPFCIQELKRSNFVLKSEIIQFLQHLDFNYEGNRYEDGEENFFYESRKNQKWSYNPSYDGKH